MNEGRSPTLPKILISDGEFGSAERTPNFASVPSPEIVISSEDDKPEAATDVESHKHLYLYSEEMDERPVVSRLISELVNYSVSVPATPADTDHSSPPSARMGTLVGVFLPCIQNIFGVILFVRLTWIIGTAGVVQAFLLVLFCVCSTLLTAISMSAIATNGVVPGGGSYFMISRSLGPEFGGAVGICFYLGTTFAGAMYIIGAVEVLVTYMAPSISIFGDITKDSSAMFNNFRFYGSCLLLCTSVLVFFGVKIVNKFAALALCCVILSVTAIYIGIFYNINGNDRLQLCVLGKRLLTYRTDVPRHGNFCSKERGHDLWNIFCHDENITLEYGSEKIITICDKYFETHNTEIRTGIKGLSSGIIVENLGPNFLYQGQFIADSSDPVDIDPMDDDAYTQLVADITTSFTILVGIFFPSVTGIMAGSNRSGDLADAQKSIPVGTIMAIICTSAVYLSCIILFGASIDGLLLRDKFGASIGGKLVIANLAWPNEWVILIGSFLSTLGAGMQSLTGAPRLLQAIAKDEIIPFLVHFSKSASNGEPRRALFLTIALCQLGILIGNLDYLAPILSNFFLMCYGFVNLACALQTLLKTPNWRPRFKFYHWSLSLAGVTICMSIMFMTGWYFALISILIAVVIYKYIEYSGAEKEWGDGLNGLALSAASFALLRLEEGPLHTKNWRPQILILADLDSDMFPKHQKLFTLASQMKAGMGITMTVCVLEGSYEKCFNKASEAKENIKKIMFEEKVKGFCDVVVSKDVTQGVIHLIQSTGLGGLRPNTVMLGWPSEWKKSENRKPWTMFIETLRMICASRMSVIVPKGIDKYPSSIDRLTGSIDVWWIVHDGGLLMLIPFLLRKHKAWKNCRMRIFTVAQIEDNSVQIKKDLKQFLYHLRIEADVETDNDISAYTYEKTLMMERRSDIMKALRINETDKIDLSAFLGERKQSLAREEIPLSLVQEIFNRRLSLPNKEATVEEASVESLKIDGESERTSNSDEENFQSKHDKSLAEGDLEAAEATRKFPNIKPNVTNIKRMDTAVKLNEVIVKKSSLAQLVIVNMPGPPKNSLPASEYNYMEFLEVLTDKLERVLMLVRNEYFMDTNGEMES